MRIFCVLFFFVCSAVARPDVSLGYKYNQPSQSYLPPISGANNNGHQTAGSLGLASSLQGVSSTQGLNLFGNGANHLGASSLHSSNSVSNGFGYREEEPLITKQFYIHSAPEDNDGYNKKKHFRLGRAQKNYRVIFIRAPSSSVNNAGITAEYAPSEEKTVIYVLSQKEHDLNIDDIATPAPTQPSKPEVYFIKYKTPEEAEHAQKEIQAKYDALGGLSQISDEGTIPVSSVEGALDVRGDFGEQGSGSNLSGAATSKGYLPPSH